MNGEGNQMGSPRTQGSVGDVQQTDKGAGEWKVSTRRSVMGPLASAGLRRT